MIREKAGVYHYFFSLLSKHESAFVGTQPCTLTYLFLTKSSRYGCFYLRESSPSLDKLDNSLEGENHLFRQEPHLRWSSAGFIVIPDRNVVGRIRSQNTTRPSKVPCEARSGPVMFGVGTHKTAGF
jgi:hypothetical protein